MVEFLIPDWRFISCWAIKTVQTASIKPSPISSPFSSNISASTGAEDFAFFAQEVPGLYFWLGVNDIGVESAPGNHTPYFVVHDSALDNGVKGFINLVSDYSSDHSTN